LRIGHGRRFRIASGMDSAALRILLIMRNRPDKSAICIMSDWVEDGAVAMVHSIVETDVTMGLRDERMPECTCTSLDNKSVVLLAGPSGQAPALLGHRNHGDTCKLGHILTVRGSKSAPSRSDLSYPRARTQ
jgi:hypothetical protein